MASPYPNLNKQPSAPPAAAEDELPGPPSAPPPPAFFPHSDLGPPPASVNCESRALAVEHRASEQKKEEPVIKKRLSYGYGQKVIKVPETGHLQVKVCEAHLDEFTENPLGTKADDAKILASPWVRCRLTSEVSFTEWKNTHYVKTKLSPTWDVTFQWKIERLTGSILELECYDNETRKKMGSTKIDLSSVLTAGLSTRKEYPLSPQGNIMLEVKYQSEGFKAPESMKLGSNVPDDIYTVKSGNYDLKCFRKKPTDSMTIEAGPKDKGAVVTEVKKGGEAAELGIEVGDVIKQIQALEVEKSDFNKIYMKLAIPKEYPVMIEFKQKKKKKKGKKKEEQKEQETASV